MHELKDPIDIDNAEIAKAMGWFQEHGHHPHTWFRRTDTAIVVAHSGSYEWSGKLNFHRKWESAMEAVEYFEKKYGVEFVIGRKQVRLIESDPKLINMTFVISEKGKLYAVWDCLRCFVGNRINFNKL